MATVHHPKHLPKNSRLYQSAITEPYILLENDDYPDEINAYISERGRGGDRVGVNRKRLRPKSLKDIAERLCNCLTFIETDSAHPSLPSLRWQDIKRWHITHLYEHAMVLGVWSQEYFLTGIASPLESETINYRVEESLRCFTWLSKHGHIGDFDDEPPPSDLEAAYRPISAQRRIAAQVKPDEPSKPSFRPRQSPGALIPPTHEQHCAFREALTPGAHRLAADLIYETGMRLSELIECTLLPGALHTRTADVTYDLPKWPRTPYRLDWSANDDRMIGVMPTREQAWNSSAQSSSDCAYRIVGKGLVIRRIYIPAKSMRTCWQYADGPRYAKLRKMGLLMDQQPAQLLLDRFGKPMTAHAIQDAFRRASTKAACGYDFTAHVLRHMFACAFLKAVILGRAKLFKQRSDNLSLELIDRHGDFAVTVLQKILGHKFRETTFIYLEQLKLSVAGLDNTISWNDFLDD